MVLELQCRRTSVKSEKFGKFDIPGYNFPFSFWRGKRHERPFISSPPTGWSSPSPTDQISNVVYLRFRVPTKVLRGEIEETGIRSRTLSKYLGFTYINDHWLFLGSNGYKQQPTLSGTRIKQTSRSLSSFILSQSNSPASVSSSSRRTQSGGGAKAQLRSTPSFFPGSWARDFLFPLSFFFLGTGDDDVELDIEPWLFGAFEK